MIDCAKVIKSIHGVLKGQANKDLILRIQELCKREWQVVIKQIPRDEFCSPNSGKSNERVFTWDPCFSCCPY